jgi:hypothetical protein
MASHRAETYRSRATACETAAILATDSKIKWSYWDLAKQWRDLARQIAMLEYEKSDR